MTPRDASKATASQRLLVQRCRDGPWGEGPGVRGLAIPSPERLPFQKLHGDERLTFVLAKFVNRADVGMIQGRGGAGFTLEALQGSAVFRQFFPQELQSHRPA